MKPLLLCGLLLVLATDALAHRLDEYLQATRVSVATNRIDLTVALTPGVAVVDQVLAIIDTDHDGRVSKDEVTAYAEGVLKDTRIEVDGKPLTFRLEHNSFPTLDIIRQGMGVIRVEATVPVESLAAGSHTVTLTNSHLASISVYLVNALVPKDRAIKINKQTRDELQRNYRLEFSVSFSPP